MAFCDVNLAASSARFPVSHPYKGVGNRETAGLHQFPTYIKRPPGNRETQADQQFTAVQTGSVSHQIPVSRWGGKPESKNTIRRRPVIVRFDRFDAGNRLAANLILEQVNAFGGEQSGLVRWARAVLRRLSRQAAKEAV